MNLVIYTKDGCPNCTAAKSLMKANGLQYEEKHLSLDDMIHFQIAYPEARQMPQIFYRKVRLGGLAGLQANLPRLIQEMKK